MKKALFLGLLVILFLNSAGQTQFGMVGGGVLAKTSDALSDKSRMGVYLGLIMDLKLGKSASLRPQLRFITKGQQNVSGEKGSYNYLELPLNLVYIIPTSNGRLSFGAGPALAYMIMGSWKVKNESKKEISFEYDNVNQFDLGLNALVGFEVKGGVFFNLQYTLGFLDVWSADQFGTNKNRALGLGIGIMF